jgi:hypothetical protein
MTEHAIVLLVCLAVIAVMAVLIYVAGRGRASDSASICEIRRTLDQILAGNRDIETTLKQHRRVLYDAHKQIHAVQKGLQKPAA